MKNGATKKRLNKDFVIFFIGVIAFMIIGLYAATYYMPDYYHLEGWFSMLTNIAISYVAAVFFYLFQVYLPQKKNEKMSLEASRSLLLDMQKKLTITALVLEQYFKLDNKCLTVAWNGSDGEEILYFNYIAVGENDKKKAMPYSYSKEDFLNLKRDLTKTIDKIKNSVYAPYYPDGMLELLSDLELTKLYDGLAAYMMFYKSDIGIDGSIEQNVCIARELADRISYYSESKFNIELVESDAASKVIARAIKNPQMLMSLSRLNTEISKELVRDGVDKKINDGIISKDDGETIIEAIDKMIQ